ncbi:peptidoglycan DD-metalloendopeptidase family protein [Heliobacterium gestii]|uniref:Peptidoglycan DD-metalloendopeptidase family protein n=1 Tax=Heliomicrobium gestii TaxID=2699 RepID=A0A845LFK5_HELGE|nr:peptidoglycan DD-metalloendopeptidase family protein [Heliomicrobium gestii]MBM7866855.1 murein DD-endopeptidase MepM/ murein hydrolase activator NlpD [Heliomicrobium gestii]MZP42283.1 peptidoglycan DD-metalloendopeptidase family protein [Heliomicrobium gestii]
MKKSIIPEGGEWILNRRRRRPAPSGESLREPEREIGPEPPKDGMGGGSGGAGGNRWLSRFGLAASRSWFPSDETARWGESPPGRGEASLLRRWLWQTAISLALFAICWQIFQFDQPWARWLQGEVRRVATENVEYEALHEAVLRLGLWTDAAAVTPVFAPAGGGARVGLPVDRPVKGILVQTYGQRGGQFYPGVRIAAPAGSAVTAGVAGKVAVTWVENGGHFVQIAVDDGTVRILGPLESTEVKTGQAVGLETLLGRLARSESDGQAQLYLEVRREGHSVDPFEGEKGGRPQ